MQVQYQIYVDYFLDDQKNEILKYYYGKNEAINNNLNFNCTYIKSDNSIVNNSIDTYISLKSEIIIVNLNIIYKLYKIYKLYLIIKKKKKE